eukprot:7707876-Heterocapsa_arctica.AAC.1
MADQCAPLWFKRTPTMPSELEKSGHEEGSRGAASIRHIGGTIVSKAMPSTECEYHPPPETCQERRSSVSARTMLHEMFKSASENCGPPKRLFSAWRPHTGAGPCRSKYRSPHKDCSFGSSTTSWPCSTGAASCVRWSTGTRLDAAVSSDSSCRGALAFFSRRCHASGCKCLWVFNRC